MEEKLVLYRALVLLRNELEQQLIGKNVRWYNKASFETRSIVSQLSKSPETRAALIRLLDDPVCAGSLAFQLMELCPLDEPAKARCIEIVKKQLGAAKEEGSATALGIEWWLRDHGVDAIGISAP